MAIPLVSVAVRIKPSTQNSQTSSSSSRLNGGHLRGAYGQFQLDTVLDEGSTQDAVFRDVAAPLVNSFLQGMSSVLLLHGAAQTGKTFTLEGPSFVVPREGHEGLIPRAALSIFTNLLVVPKHRYKLYATYCALSAGMDATLADLLCPGGAAVSLKEVSAAGALQRLVHFELTDRDDIYEVLRQGRANRATALLPPLQPPTTAGLCAAAAAGGPPHSARYSPPPAGIPAHHAMLVIQLVGCASDGQPLTTQLTFLELAAPEPREVPPSTFSNTAVDPSANAGMHARSLSLAFTTLSAVINNLRGGATTHTPWRDSPLTRWLKPCLTAAGCIAVLATVGPGAESAPNTLSTLSYVSRFRTPPPNSSSSATAAPLPGTTITATWEAAASGPNNSNSNNNNNAVSAGPLSYASVRNSWPGGSASPRSQSPHITAPGTHLPPPDVASYLPPAAADPDDAGQSSARTNIASSSSRASSAEEAGVAAAAAAAAHHDTIEVRRSTSPGRRSRLDRSPPRGSGSTGRLSPQDMLLLSSIASAGGRPGSAARVSALRRLGAVSTSGLVQPLSLQDSLSPPPHRGPGLSVRERVGGGSPERVPSSERWLGGVSSVGAFGGFVTVAGGGVDGFRCKGGDGVRPLSPSTNVAPASLPTRRPPSPPLLLPSPLAVEAMRDKIREQARRLEDARLERELLVRRVQGLSDDVGSARDAQAASELLRAQCRAKSEEVCAQRNALERVSRSLGEAHAEVCGVAADRDRAVRVSEELAQRLQDRVHTLSAETSRLKGMASEAADDAAQQASLRTTLEGELAAARRALDGAAAREGGAAAAAAGLGLQLAEAGRAVAVARAERSAMQESKWRGEEALEGMKGQADSAAAALQAASMDARAAATRHQSELRSAVSVAENAHAELGSAHAMVSALQQQLKAAEAAAHESGRREAAAVRDAVDLETVLRELDRDLEVQALPLWRALRSERADTLMTHPLSSASGGGGSSPGSRRIPPAARWQPVLVALVGVLRRSVIEAEERGGRGARPRHPTPFLCAQLSRSEEAASRLAGLDTLRLELLDERRASLLMEQGLEDAHRQLEDLRSRSASAEADAAGLRQALRAAAGHNDSLHQQAEALGRRCAADAARAEAEREGTAAAVAEARARELGAVEARAAEMREEGAELQAQLHSRDQLLSLVSVEVLSAHAFATASLAAHPPAPATSPSSLFPGSPSARLLHPGSGSPTLAIGSGSGSAMRSGGHSQPPLLAACLDLRQLVTRLATDLACARKAHGEAAESRLALLESQSRVSALTMDHAAAAARADGAEAAGRQEGVARLATLQALHASEARATSCATALASEQTRGSTLAEDLALAARTRDMWQSSAASLELQLQRVCADMDVASADANRCRMEAAAAAALGGASLQRVAGLESQLQDTVSQLEALSLRLAATERALHDANARSADLGGRLVVSEAAAKLAAIESAATVASAKDGEALAQTKLSDTLSQLQWRVKDGVDEAGRLKSEVEGLRAEAREAGGRADEAARTLAEAKVGTHVHGGGSLRAAHPSASSAHVAPSGHAMSDGVSLRCCPVPPAPLRLWAAATRLRRVQLPYPCREPVRVLDAEHLQRQLSRVVEERDTQGNALRQAKGEAAQGGSAAPTGGPCPTPTSTAASSGVLTVQRAGTKTPGGAPAATLIYRRSRPPAPLAEQSALPRLWTAALTAAHDAACEVWASDEARTLRRQLDTLAEQLARASAERVALAAHVEANRLDALLGAASARQRTLLLPTPNTAALALLTRAHGTHASPHTPLFPVPSPVTLNPQLQPFVVPAYGEEPSPPTPTPTPTTSTPSPHKASAGLSSGLGGAHTATAVSRSSSPSAGAWPGSYQPAGSAPVPVQDYQWHGAGAAGRPGSADAHPYSYAGHGVSGAAAGAARGVETGGVAAPSVHAAPSSHGHPQYVNTPDLPFSEYTVLESLGSGGTCRVWLVLVKESTSILSGKIIGMHLAHSHIAKVWKVHKTPAALEIYFECDHASSLELNLGTSLKLSREMQPDGQLLAMPEHHIAMLISQVAKALEYLHDVKGVVHRDIKPANVLLSVSEHGHMNAQLIDFGSAKCCDSREPCDDLVLVSPYYAAPEYFTGGVVALGRPYDMWCLGATLFQLGTGGVPFPYDPTNTATAVPAWVTEQSLPPIPEYVPQCMAEVILKLCTHDPSKRLTAKELLAEKWLSEFVSGLHTFKTLMRSILG
ncbi:MAG: hypothetical protein WDW36_001110 [Sanguina aurantia]